MQDSLNKPTYSPFSPIFFRSWLVWGCAAIFYGYQFMLRVSPGVMAEDLMRDFGVDACALGTLTGFYYYAYSALQIPVGSLMDHFKPRRMLTIAALLCGVGCFLFSSADSLTFASIGRALIGAGSAVGFLSCLKLGTLWFPQHHLSLVLGMTVLLGTSGAISAGTPTAWLVEHTGWRTSLLIGGGVGAGIALLAWILVRDKPPGWLNTYVLDAKSENKSEENASFFENIMTIVSNPQSWLIALYGALLYVPLSGFADIWGVPFLTTIYGLDRATAGAGIAAFYGGLGLASPIYPFLSQQLQAFKPSVFIAAIIPAFPFLALLYLPCPIWLVFVLLFFSGALLSGQFLAFSMTCAINPLYASATAGGFHNMMCMLSGVIFQPFIGWLLHHFWKGEYRDSIPYYGPYEYGLALSSIPLSLFIAAAIVPLLKERYHHYSLEQKP